eukprot:TRINITY_DN10868_c0_g3_i1.p1 TRINITY_DN10868_c0_g3~~TRINITY_DN10868_c0_g3_i1.p1  ORF type:complete len:247 (-),score=47.10 TRINITY_DN10868_c0_g3_i1:215-955(-)
MRNATPVRSLHASTGGRPMRRSMQVVALPRVASTPERGCRVSGSSQSAGEALMQDAESNFSDDEEKPGLSVLPSPTFPSSEIAVAAAWARAAFLAATKDASDSESESSRSDEDLSSFADSSSQIAVAAAGAHSVFASAPKDAPDAESEPPGNGNVKPEFSVQHRLPSILRRKVSTSACSLDETDNLQDPEDQEQKVDATKCLIAYRPKSVCFAPLPECKCSEMVSPSTVAASESDKQGSKSLQSEC